MRTDVSTALRTLLTGDSTLNSLGIGQKVVQRPIDIDLKDISVTPPYIVFTVSRGPTSEGLPMEILDIIISVVVAGKTDKPLDASNLVMDRVLALLDRRPENLANQHCYFLIKQGAAQGHDVDLDLFITTTSFIAYINVPHLEDIK